MLFLIDSRESATRFCSISFVQDEIVHEVSKVKVNFALFYQQSWFILCRPDLVSLHSHSVNFLSFIWNLIFIFTKFAELYS